ncbi:(Na+)-NQR maturation NqrM [Echinimonas agarilytica]|uniref:(Na+)-NQR maturation NqrM n=1 Tax=Echinimonas agarilytica TaxID=1215918 RepID=A0AA41W915_9GAMM|nr:(Na+)-NQR maturation NqrM [Echinimonas agarilytica]MCM2680571.1 (Na+)-NQR maturation NqrM [Echinimonas agarilytica]
MLTFAVAFVVLLLVVAAMSVGYIVQRKTISGSCGGIAALGMAKVCDCPEPCEKRRKREAKEEKAALRQKIIDENRIL